MTILQALNSYYERMADRREVEPPGFSREKISFAIELSLRGKLVGIRDLRAADGKRLVPALLAVPAAVKRTVAILPNLFWDKSAYALGRTAGDGRRTIEEHAAFKTAHFELLAGCTEPGLLSLKRFLEEWMPSRFDAPPFATEMLDTNIVFRLESDDGFLHEREAARRLLASRDVDSPLAFCLVTGQRRPVQRLHPTIKGVEGAQSSGASLVSFNLDAFTSYGKEQGDNAPTSQEAAFRYGAALNRLLDRNTSRNRIRIGDATVVFWAETSGVGEPAAQAAEDFFASLLEPPDDQTETAKIGAVLEALAKGRPVEQADPDLKEGTAFHILGLAPNAARLSVRFWFDCDFSTFARRLAEHYRDLHVEPPPWGNKLPAVQRLLVKTTALQEKFDNIPPLLAGEMMRAVLTGGRYPRALLSAVITRLRAGDDPGRGWHAAAIKAFINRFEEDKVPVARDPNLDNVAYQLGRLFALLELAQYAALDRVNAPIGDRYYGAASSTPARVFGPLLRGLRNHLSGARKRGRGAWAHSIEIRIIQAMENLPEGGLPRTLRLEDQGRFAVGYYHERATKTSKEAGADEPEGDAE